MVTIYVLKLQQDKIYVGKTSDELTRLVDHIMGIGSAFTKKYEPIEIIEILENADDYDEDKYVKKYMSKYGLDNVRGGSYSQLTLDNNTKKFLMKEIYGSNDKCFNCGKDDHFIKKCPYQQKIIWVCNKCDTGFDTKLQAKRCQCNKYKCYRCKRYGHWLNDCYAKTDISGNRL